MALTRFTGLKPQRNDKATFAARADAFVTWWLDIFWGEIDAAVTAFNLNSTNSNSTTSLTITTGVTTLTVQPNKSYVPGMFVVIGYTTDGTKWMFGNVTAYNSSTGVLDVDVTNISAAGGTFAVWSISMSTPVYMPAVPAHQIKVHTGNGFGTTDTSARRFTTVILNVGTSATYADSAAHAGTITINTSGVYSISWADSYGSGGVGGSGAITLNSTQLTDVPININVANRLAYIRGVGTFNQIDTITWVGRLAAGDVVRFQADPARTPSGAEADETFIHIMRLS